MAIEAVKEIVTKFQSIQAQIAEKQAELEKLKKAHLDFWAKFQRECSETGHSLTDKEKDAIKHPGKYNTGRLTVFEHHMWMLELHGYRCDFCLRRVPGQVEDWSPKLDLCKRESFDKWLGYKEDKWPSDKKAILQKVKKEVDGFFAKAEPLEQEIEKLKKEEKEYRDLLEPIWELLDNALGYAKRRKKREEAVRDGYEQKIRDIEYAHRPPPPFGDPDAFWD